MISGSARAVILEFWRVQEGGDYLCLVDLFAEDARLEDPIWGLFEGRDAIRGFMTTMVSEMQMRHVHFTVDEICGDETTAWARWTMHSPAGARSGVGIYRVKDGKITYYRDYLDAPEKAPGAG